MSIFLFILIVTSAMQISGYALVDVLLMGCFLFLINLKKTSIKIQVNAVLIFCIYMILQVFRGMYVLEDVRMVYWLLFFVIVYFSHLYILDLQKKDLINSYFAKRIFDFSMVYFILYGLLALSFTNADDYQGIFWAGSSAAFIILIPFLCSHFILFDKSRYSLSALRLPSLLLYLAVSIIHYSRVGMYLLFLYFLYLAYKAIAFNFKKLFLVFLVFIISFFVLDVTRTAYYDNPDTTSELGSREITQITSLMDDNNASLEDLESDAGRFLMILSVSKKFISSPSEFLVGSGWYTSRETLKPFEAEVFSDFGMEPSHIHNNKPMQVTSFAGIISDTGIIGLFFIIYFFIRSSIQILRVNSNGSLLIIGFLLINALFYIIGFTFISIISFLLIFPDGILVNLARAGSKSNKPLKQIY